MDAAATIRSVRRQAGLSQGELAARAGTSQATVSAYENGAKEPSTTTFERLLAAAGWRLTVEPSPRHVVVGRTYADLDRAGRVLAEVLALAEALPVRHTPTLRYPPLRRSAP